MKSTAPGWQVRCRKCNLKIEAGRAGIIRFGAIGTSHKLGRCSRCNRLRWLTVERRTDPVAESKSAEGYAPGWIVRCTQCGKTVEAQKIGFIAGGEEVGGEVVGPCTRCEKRRQKLMLERAPVPTPTDR